MQLINQCLRICLTRNRIDSRLLPVNIVFINEFMLKAYVLASGLLCMLLFENVASSDDIQVRFIFAAQMSLPLYFIFPIDFLYFNNIVPDEAQNMD